MNGMIFRSFRKWNSSQKNTNTIYSEYSYSGIVPKECAQYNPRGGGGTPDFSDRDDQGNFGGFEFSILGFSWVGKFDKYFFGWLDLSRDLSRDFLGYSK